MREIFRKKVFLGVIIATLLLLLPIKNNVNAAACDMCYGGPVPCCAHLLIMTDGNSGEVVKYAVTGFFPFTWP